MIHRILGIFLFVFAVAGESRAQAVVDISPEPSTQVSLGAFKNGWALVREGNDEYYINTQGEKIRIMGREGAAIGSPLAIEAYEQEREENPSGLPGRAIVFEKNGLRGVLDPWGEVLIPAEYNHIETEYAQFWTVYKNNGKSLYLPDESILPFFEDIGYLDGEYFDVKQDGAWHLYHKSSGRIITKNAYEAFDYCGGCGLPSPYVYAKKDGKWGIIDWEENVLVPFEYDHEHRGMRSDNWVASFSKNGQGVIVHIPTQQEFGSDNELVSGMLVVRKDGKYGAYNREGELAVPFGYDRMESPNDNHYLGYYGDYLVVEQHGLKGVVRSDGELVVPTEYEEVMVYDDYFVVSRGGQTSLLAEGSTEPLVEVGHGEITHINNSFYSSGSHGLSVFKVKKQAYYGLYSADSDMLIEPEFYGVSLVRNDYFDGGRVVVADKQGQKSLFSLDGELLLPFQIADFDLFDTNAGHYLAFQAQGKWGLYDVHNQKEIVPARYDRYFRVLENPASHFIRATIEEEGKPDQYVLYHVDGQIVIEQPFSTIEAIDDQHYLIGRSEAEEMAYAIFNTETRMLERLRYRFAGLSDSPGLLVVSNDKVTGKLYRVAEEKELQRDYRIFLFSGAISEDGGYPDAHDDWVLSYFSNGLARVDTREGMGYIDAEERVVIEPKYERVSLMGDQHAVVSEVNQYGDLQLSYLIDRSGQRVFPEEYYVDDVFFYNQEDYGLEDVAILTKNEVDADRYYGYTPYLGLGDLNTGKMLTDAKYREIIPLRHAPYLILEQIVPSEDGSTAPKYGLANKRGEILFEPQFEDIYYDDFQVMGNREEDGTDDIFPLLVREGGNWRYINGDGTYLPFVGDYAHRY